MNGLYDFPFREYEPNQGRWISPDPAGLKAVNPMNPQSWNRYAYVSNTPLNAIDPSGLLLYDCGWSGGCNGMAVDGWQSNVSTALGWGESIVPCPNNICDGFTDKGQYFQFFAGAGGASGYMKFSDIVKGDLYEVNGGFYNTQGMLQLFYQQVMAQLAKMQALLGGNPTPIGISGGNVDFNVDDQTFADYTNGNTCYSGADSTRCDGDGFSLHFTPDPNGGYDVHMDSANPFGSGLFGLNWAGLWEHFGLDLIGGNSLWWIVPH
jgi:RHS repeat-associated protein